MGLTYFKRYRMEISLAGRVMPEPPVIDDYRLVSWRSHLVDAHAEILYRSFRHEIDANVFLNLGCRDGCQRLMDEISRRDSFIPGATWLIEYWPAQNRKPELVGTIQGLGDEPGLGAIQNIGIAPMHRGRGLGTILIEQSLAGFQHAGVSRVQLEVTAQNLGAVRLYQRLGFRRTKTVYKASDIPEVAYM